MKRLFNTLFLFLMGGILMAQNSQEKCSNDRAYLGIYTSSVSESKAELLQLPNDEGSLITQVLIGGAADKAGLQPFDYIYSIDDHELDRRDDLTDVLLKYQAGDQANVHIVRNGRPMTINLILGRQSDSMGRNRHDNEYPFLGISNRGSEEDEIGIKISVVRNSTAETLGLQSGDKILRINGFPMIDWSDVTTAIQMMEVGNDVTVEYERDGRTTSVSGLIRSREDSGREETEYEAPVVDHAFLGIISRSISGAKAKKLGFENPYGSYVEEVFQNTAAERAGIQPFDYIYGIDEYRTGDGQSLTHILHRYEVGDRATVHYVRRSQDRQIQVRFGSRDEARRREIDKCDGPYFGIQASHSYNERTGVSVNVISNSTAQAIGLKNQDLITRINDHPMIDWEDIGIAIDNMTVGSPIKVEWVRNGRDMSGQAPIMSYCQTKTNQLVPERIPADVSRRSPQNVDLDDVEVIVSDVHYEEANEMKRRYQVALSTDNQINMRAIRIATQPAKGVFQVSFLLPDRGDTVVKIYNNLGRDIYVSELVNFSGEFSDEVDLSQNGPGTYYLLVKQNGRSASKRLILRKG